MSSTRAVWIFLAILTGIRLTLLGTTDLSFDEAHYWMWSERLGPAYFSKGPGVAYAIWSSVAIFGPTEFGVRFWSPLLGAGTSLLLYYFARRLYSETTGLWLVLALNILPIFNVGSFVMTTDPLSIFFWAAAMFTFWLALERSPAFSWYWPGTGLLIGLGFLCKYTNAMQLLSVGFILALTPRLRREFARPGLYALLVMFLICTIPPIIWNQQHAWSTVTHLRTRGSLDHPPGFHPLELISFFAMHFAVYSPLIFLALAWAVVASWRRAHQQFKGIYLIWMGFPLFAIYALLSINHAANANWDGLAILSFGVLAASYWRERLESRPSMKPLVATAFVVGLALSLLALNSDLLRSFGVALPAREPSTRIRGWKSASAAVEEVRGEAEKQLGQRLFLIADERDRASEFAFYFRDKRIEAPGHPPAYIVESQNIVNQFSFWPRYDEVVAATAEVPRPAGDVYTEEGGVNPFEGRSALFVQANEKEDVPRNITRGFQSVEPYRVIEVRRFGKVMRRLQVYVCKNYRMLSL